MNTVKKLKSKSAPGNNKQTILCWMDHIVRYVFNEKKMSKLLQNFYNLANGRYTLFDALGNLVFSVGCQSSFCDKIIQTSEGSVRCKEDDLLHLHKSLLENNKGVYVYLCHCGLLNAVIPIRDIHGLMGYLVFGQFIDDSSLPDQWNSIKQRLLLFDDIVLDELENDFYALPHYSVDTIISCSELLAVCTEYIRNECIIPENSKNLNDLLENYIATNYADNLSLNKIADFLHISKSKLCSIAAERGTTITKMVNEQRMKSAAIRLVTTANRISEISTEVGIEDYNYFTKLFRKQYNCSPREYRKGNRDKLRVDRIK